MELVRIEKKNEGLFLDSAKGKELEYYWFLVDWAEEPDKCIIYAAMDQNRMRGALLTYDGRFTQIRGDPEAVKLLTDRLEGDEVEVTLPVGTEGPILDRFLPELTFTMLVLHVTRSAARSRSIVMSETLSDQDAQDVVDVMLAADSPMWVNVRLDDIKESMREGYWVGVRDNGRLVGFAGCAMRSDIPNVSTVAVLEPYRNKGLARSLVSTIVQEIMKTREQAIIHVRENNAPARKAYESVGFKVQGRYTFIRGKRKSLEDQE